MSESPWNFGGESVSVGGGYRVTLVDGATFLVCGRSGDITGFAAEGLFMLDTRVLSHWVLRVNDHRVEPLSVSANGPFSSTFVGRVDLDSPVDAPIVVVQRRNIGRGMREDLEIRNHGTAQRTMVIELGADADFHGLFAVKAGHEVDPRRGVVRPVAGGVLITPPAESANDTPVQAVIVRSSVAPASTTAAGALRWTAEIPPGATWRTCIEVSIRAGDAEIEPTSRCGTAIEHAVPVSRLRKWRNAATRITTDHDGLAAALHRSVEDLGALRIFDPDHADRVVVAAGAPWFMTLFGRDSLLTSWMALPVDRGLASGVLAELADTQGSVVDPLSEEEPGRILHEVRFDRLTARLLGGNGRYYGSVDATPLFVCLVAELMRWTGVDERITSLMPAVDRALDWMDRFGDRDGDGFVEYLRADERGLEHQGWKDSWDGIRHTDGRVASPPIALCEVQGYAYAAWRGRADLARATGESDEAAAAYDARAEAVRRRFDETFWIPDNDWYAVGLDADKHRIGSLTSNLGHLLWTGIVPEERAPRLAELLTAPRMFSGWGLRTLASDAIGYNPLSYHCGSVWPHDTAIAVAGLARYRADDAVQRLVTALVDASARSGGRLPELFGGFARDDLPAPVPYPASCSPQAWAAASPLLLVRALLGLEPDAPARRVRLRPRLPPVIGMLRIDDMPLGGSRLTVVVERDRVDVEVSGVELEVQVDTGTP